MSKLENRNSRRNVVSEATGRVSFESRFSNFAASLAATAMGLLAARPTLAQGCALCYNTAAAASGKGITALRHGVLILMLPPMVIFGVVTFFTVRGRNRFNDEAESFEDQDRAA
jgi:hypothetical protein